jgi:hypothetical protein
LLVRMAPSEKAQLAQLAAAEQRTLAGMIRRLIVQEAQRRLVELTDDE